MPRHVSERYSWISDDVIAFISRVDLFARADEQLWLHSLASYKRHGPWPYDSIEAIEVSDAEAEDVARVTDFWNRHFPIGLSVRTGDYCYLAMSCPTQNIVVGVAPFFDEPAIVCESLPELLLMLESDPFQIAEVQV
jgi:hypothetical protein